MVGGGCLEVFFFPLSLLCLGFEMRAILLGWRCIRESRFRQMLRSAVAAFIRNTLDYTHVHASPFGPTELSDTAVALALLTVDEQMPISGRWYFASTSMSVDTAVRQREKRDEIWSSN